MPGTVAAQLVNPSKTPAWFGDAGVVRRYVDVVDVEPWVGQPVETSGKRQDGDDGRDVAAEKWHGRQARSGEAKRCLEE